jgi:formylglycine-generating enzyme
MNIQDSADGSVASPSTPQSLAKRRTKSGRVSAWLLALAAAAAVAGAQASVHAEAQAAPRPNAIQNPGAQPANPETKPEAEANADAQSKGEWTLVDRKHWQLKTSHGEPTEVTDTREGNRGACPAGMVEVEGKMKQGNIDALQLQTCTDWIRREFPERCGAYDKDKWLALSKALPTKPMHFCMDRYEFPNQKDENPMVMVTWFEAKDACKAAGKRLCTEDEWTFACEGEEAQPYPTGYNRDASACMIDEQWDVPKEGSLLPRASTHARDEIERLWHAAPSGSARSCKSPFGIYDMTGNIDEWTRSSIPGERPSILKGGYFGPVRTRCRPATRAHGEGHVYYQQGFRCCSSEKQ